MKKPVNETLTKIQVRLTIDALRLRYQATDGLAIQADLLRAHDALKRVLDEAPDATEIELTAVLP